MTSTEKKHDRRFIIAMFAGTLMINAVIFGYLYGQLETNVGHNTTWIQTLATDFKSVPERLARIEALLQQMMARVYANDKHASTEL